MFRKSLLALTVSAILFALNPALAHDGATGIIKERMKVMKFIGQNTKMIAPFAMGALDMNYKSVETSAQQISMAAESALAKFPKGSTSEESEAKPNIWENWAEFEGLLKKLSADAAQLQEMAKNEEFDLQEQFEKMAGNCKTCHTKFRQKKN